MEASARILEMQMLKNASEDIKLSQENAYGATVAMDTQPHLDVEAAVSLKNVFFFFSLVFRYPRETVYLELERLLPLFGNFMNAYSSNVPELPKAGDLQAEYIRLFVNSRDGVPAVPYASYHIDGGVLKGESYYKLRQIMGETGFVLDESVGELEDHLAVLLEFCSMLTDRLIRVSASGGAQMEEIRNTIGEVIARYLQPSVRAITASISKCAAMEFYAVSTRALRNFLAEVKMIYAHVFSVPVSAAIKTGVKK